MARTVLGTNPAQAYFQQWITGKNAADWQKSLPELDTVLSRYGYTRDVNTSRYFTGNKASFVDVIGANGQWGWTPSPADRRLMGGAMGSAAAGAVNAAAPPPTMPTPNTSEDASAKYRDAYAAAMRTRMRARATGRNTLIGGGFGPRTTALGGQYGYGRGATVLGSY